MRDTTLIHTAVCRDAKAALEITEAWEADSWDRQLAASPLAHPLQAWVWGEARESCGERVIRLHASHAGEPVVLAQIVLQRLARVRLPVAWIGRGPVWMTTRPELRATAAALLKRALASHGARLMVARGYVDEPNGRIGWPVPWERAAWSYRLDLTQPVEVLEQRLHREWRYGKNRFAREGGCVVEAEDEAVLDGLVRMRDATADRKRFTAYGKSDFVRAVWRAFRRRQSGHVSIHLFQAQLGDRTPAAAIVIRVGGSAHYMWGAFDYDARLARVSEGLQWGIVERLRAMGAVRYDLEGADRRGAPGVYEFKKRMGGELVRLGRTVWTPLLGIATLL